MINQRLSLVIPRVFPQWIDEAKIIKIFCDQKIGIISKVSIVRMPDEKGRNRQIPIYKAYLYFSVWFENIIAENFQGRIYGKERQARVVYDDPWYWIVFENTERVHLSKNDKRLMRLSAEMYKNQAFLQEQQEQNARELDEQKQKLAEQNNTIQILQDFCVQNGLEIPFWSAKHPPSAEVSSLEALSAATAVACAEFVLYDDQHNESEQEHVDYYSVPYECAESVLYEDAYEVGAYEVGAYEVGAYEVGAYEVDAYEVDAYDVGKECGNKFNYDFIPVKSYEEDWKTENPFTDNVPEQSRLCSYLGSEFNLDAMVSLPMYM